MPALAPLLVAAVFATVLAGLSLPTAAATPALHSRRWPLAMLGVLAACAASTIATLLSLGLVALPPPPLPVQVGIVLALRLLVLAAVAAGLAWQYRRRRPDEALAPVVALVGAAAGLAAQVAASVPAALLAAAGTAAALLAILACLPALHERLLAGDPPARLRGRPLRLLAATIAALACWLALTLALAPLPLPPA